MSWQLLHIGYKITLLFYMLWNITREEKYLKRKIFNLVRQSTTSDLKSLTNNISWVCWDFPWSFISIVPRNVCLYKCKNLSATSLLLRIKKKCSLDSTCSEDSTYEHFSGPEIFLHRENFLIYNKKVPIVHFLFCTLPIWFNLFLGVVAASFQLFLL